MKIVEKTVLTDNELTRIVRMKIEAPRIAQKAQAGQFVVVMVSEEGERIPLTIVDATDNCVTIVFQEVGVSTRLLGAMNVGDELYSFVGPLGHATEIKKYGNVILVAGGVGIAEIYPVAKRMTEVGNATTVIIGARTKDILFLEEELTAVSHELHVVTDDGSRGVKGFTTDVLHALLEKKTYDRVYAVGPIPMMRKVAEVSQKYGVKAIVSLNSIMLDGTGMCGCCRVTIDGNTQFACVDGPDFDAHVVDWDELTLRTRTYKKQEEHICKLHDML